MMAPVAEEDAGEEGEATMTPRVRKEIK